MSTPPAETQKAPTEPVAQERSAVMDHAPTLDVQLNDIFDRLGNTPLRDGLGRYFAEPSMRAQTDDGSQPTDQLTNFEKTAAGIAASKEAVRRGETTATKLVGGMIIAERTTDGENLRPAFENVVDVLASGWQKGFHDIFTPKGPKIGDMPDLINYKGAESPQNAALLAAGGREILAGRESVMFGDSTGRLGSKLLGIADTKNGGLPHKNVFLLVRSPIFDDPQGSRATMSNFAYAELVMIPDAVSTEPEGIEAPIDLAQDPSNPAYFMEGPGSYARDRREVVGATGLKGALAPVPEADPSALSLVRPDNSGAIDSDVALKNVRPMASEAQPVDQDGAIWDEINDDAAPMEQVREAVAWAKAALEAERQQIIDEQITPLVEGISPEDGAKFLNFTYAEERRIAHLKDNKPVGARDYFDRGNEFLAQLSPELRSRAKKYAPLMNRVKEIHRELDRLR